MGFEFYSVQQASNLHYFIRQALVLVCVYCCRTGVDFCQCQNIKKENSNFTTWHFLLCFFEFFGHNTKGSAQHYAHPWNQLYNTQSTEAKEINTSLTQLLNQSKLKAITPIIH